MEAAAAQLNQTPEQTETKNRNMLRAIVVGPIIKQNLTTGATKELPEDDLVTKLVNEGRIIQPPFEKLVLAMLPEQSTSMGPVIEAMVTNIEGFGFRLQPYVHIENEETPEDIKKEVLEEKAKLVNFFANCTQDYSFTELRRRTRHDIESTGEAFWEVLRTKSGQIVGFNHIPSYQIRLGVQDESFTQYTRTAAMAQADGSRVLEKVTMLKRFRPLCQVRAVGHLRVVTNVWKQRWFKEFRDPRMIDNRTGQPVPPADQATFKEEDKASELIHWKIYSPRSPYGMPRYIGNLITIFGDRAADEINYVTMRNNNIPSLVVLVSNGQLTQGSIDRIQEFVEQQIQGSDNYSRFLILEGEGQFEGADTGHIKLDIKPLTSEQVHDQLFQNYSKNNGEKVREAWRMPPIFTGKAQDYTRATAESSRRLADEQIFKPERDEFDVAMNRMLADMGMKYHAFISNGPNVTDDQDLIKILAAAERSGGVTPRIARLILMDIFGREDLPPLDKSIKQDIPFSLTLAEALKNTAGIDANTAPVNQTGGGAVGQSPPGVKAQENPAQKSMLKSLLWWQNELEQAMVKEYGEDWRDLIKT